MATDGTVGDLIEKALSDAQLDATLAPLARGRYNDILRKWSKDVQFPYFRVVADPESFISGQKEYDLPEDYNRSDDCFVWQNSQQGSQILIISNDRFRQFASGSIIGTPRYATIDLGRRKIIFQSVPSGGEVSFSLAYFRKATMIDVEGGDDEDTPDFEGWDALLQELTARLMKWIDDERAPGQKQEASTALRDERMNSYDSDDDSIVELAPSKFRPGVRPLRGGNSSGGWGND